MNTSAMAVYQFSNTELEEIRIVLEHTRKVVNRCPITCASSTSGVIPAVCDRHIVTINNILVARSRK